MLMSIPTKLIGKVFKKGEQFLILFNRKQEWFISFTKSTAAVANGQIEKFSISVP